VKALAANVACEAARLLIVALFVCAVLAAAGCATGGGNNARSAPDAGGMRDPIRRAQAVQALAFDLRCDGEFDFRAKCLGNTDLDDRLDALEDLDPDTLADLRKRAREINDRWDGE